MKVKLLVALALLCAVTGCREWPDPVIRSITPPRMIASEQTRIEVRADLPLPTTVDYSDGSAEVDVTAELQIGRTGLGEGTYPDDGVFEVDVPTLFEPGTYDVRITLGDGREAVLADGFTVDPGQWPDGYAIDPIGPQRPFVPFTITVRAQGANAATFRGNVRLEVPTGATIGPSVSGRFVDGVLSQQIVLSSVRNQELVIVSDVAGHRATSNSFPLQ